MKSKSMNLYQFSNYSDLGRLFDSTSVTEITGTVSGGVGGGSDDGPLSTAAIHPMSTIDLSLDSPFSWPSAMSPVSFGGVHLMDSVSALMDNDFNTVVASNGHSPNIDATTTTTPVISSRFVPYQDRATNRQSTITTSTTTTASMVTSSTVLTMANGAMSHHHHHNSSTTSAYSPITPTEPPTTLTASFFGGSSSISSVSTSPSTSLSISTGTKPSTTSATVKVIHQTMDLGKVVKNRADNTSSSSSNSSAATTSSSSCSVINNTSATVSSTVSTFVDLSTSRTNNHLSSNHSTTSPPPPPSSSASTQNCKICGDVALGKNFGVVTCGSCKIFFRRNIVAKERLQCRNSGRCTISKANRRNCAACRLVKCIQLGMKVKQNKQSRSHAHSDTSSSGSGPVLVDERHRSASSSHSDSQRIRLSSESDLSRYDANVMVMIDGDDVEAEDEDAIVEEEDSRNGLLHHVGRDSDAVVAHADQLDSYEDLPSLVPYEQDEQAQCTLADGDVDDCEPSSAYQTTTATLDQSHLLDNLDMALNLCNITATTNGHQNGGSYDEARSRNIIQSEPRSINITGHDRTQCRLSSSHHELPQAPPSTRTSSSLVLPNEDNYGHNNNPTATTSDTNNSVSVIKANIFYQHPQNQINHTHHDQSKPKLHSQESAGQSTTENNSHQQQHHQSTMPTNSGPDLSQLMANYSGSPVFLMLPESICATNHGSGGSESMDYDMAESTAAAMFQLDPKQLNTSHQALIPFDLHESISRLDNEDNMIEQRDGFNYSQLQGDHGSNTPYNYSNMYADNYYYYYYYYKPNGASGSGVDTGSSTSSVELCKAEAKNFGDPAQTQIAELCKLTPLIKIKLGLEYNGMNSGARLYTKELEKINRLNLSCRMISAKPHSTHQMCAIFSSLERGIFHANKSFKLFEQFWGQNSEISELIRQNETGFNKKKNKLLHMLYHLRGVQNFDEKENAWAVFNGGCDNTFTLIKLEMFKHSIKKEMSNVHRQYITSFPEDWRKDPTIFNLMTYLLLFGAFQHLHPQFQCEKLRYFKYLYLFKRYFECMYQDERKALQMMNWMLKLIRDLSPLCSDCLTACTHSLNPQLLKKIGPNYAACLMLELQQKQCSAGNSNNNNNNNNTQTTIQLISSSPSSPISHPHHHHEHYQHHQTSSPSTSSSSSSTTTTTSTANQKRLRESDDQDDCDSMIDTMI